MKNTFNLFSVNRVVCFMNQVSWFGFSGAFNWRLITYLRGLFFLKTVFYTICCQKYFMQAMNISFLICLSLSFLRTKKNSDIRASYPEKLL